MEEIKGLCDASGCMNCAALNTSIGAQYDLEMGLVKTSAWVQDMQPKDFLAFLLISLPCEAAEVLDEFKKPMDGRREFSRENTLKELSDVLWSVSLLAQELGSTMDEVLVLGMKKMRGRYPDRYTAIPNCYIGKER